jgi:hypothetical protein
MRRLGLIAGLIALIVVSSLLGRQHSPRATAQDDGAAGAANACIPVLQAVYEDFAASCAALGGGAACAGAANASATGTDANFSAVGDTLALGTFDSITTPAFDLATEQWGAAAINTHANIPLALSDVGVRMIALGETTIENMVAAEDAFVPAAAVEVTVLVGANLRLSPSTEGTVFASARVGSTLMADAQTVDGAWLRVMTETQEIVWISSQVVNGTGLADLPRYSRDSRTLMQSFKFKTGAADASCGDAANALVLQAPNQTVATVTANGQDIRIASTIVLRTVDQQMQLIVLSGSATVNSISVPAGFTMFAPLRSDGMVSEGGWTGFRAIDDADRAFLNPLPFVPEALLYYPITIPTPEQVLATLEAINRASAGTASVSRLREVNCGRFVPTSPLGGMPLDSGTIFYWDPASGADNYQLNIYNDGGAQVLSRQTNSANTSLPADTTAASIGNGTNFSWEVVALYRGQAACTSARVNIVRDANAVGVAGSGGAGTAGTGGSGTGGGWGTSGGGGWDNAWWHWWRGFGR